MRITILTSDVNHPCIPYLHEWCSNRNQTLAIGADGLPGGDVLFAISCTEILTKEQRDKYQVCCVLHESDLPKGRGWSPLAWQILDGNDKIVICLIEMADSVDTGDIFDRWLVTLEGHELYGEIHSKIVKAKLQLIDRFLEALPTRTKQEGEATYYDRRRPHNSELDVSLSIADQFDLLRICDPRFPAYFKMRGHTYKVTVEKQ